MLANRNVQIIKRFDIVLLDPVKPIQTVNMMLFSQWGMWVRITKREEAGEEIVNEI
jgi:hypothetical protein